MTRQKKPRFAKMFFRVARRGTPTESIDCWTKWVLLEDKSKIEIAD